MSSLQEDKQFLLCVCVPNKRASKLYEIKTDRTARRNKLILCHSWETSIPSCQKWTDPMGRKSVQTEIDSTKPSINQI